MSLPCETYCMEFPRGSLILTARQCKGLCGLKLVLAGAVSLRDDMRAYLPDVLPKFIALFQEAEREGSYQMVQPALDALEALGPALEDHLQLLLPALVRLIPPGADLITAEIRFPSIPGWPVSCRWSRTFEWLVGSSICGGKGPTPYKTWLTGAGRRGLKQDDAAGDQTGDAAEHAEAATPHGARQAGQQRAAPHAAAA